MDDLNEKNSQAWQAMRIARKPAKKTRRTRPPLTRPVSLETAAFVAAIYSLVREGVIDQSVLTQGIQGSTNQIADILGDKLRVRLRESVVFAIQAPLIELQMRDQTATDVIAYYYSFMRLQEYELGRFPYKASKAFWRRVWSNAEQRSPRIRTEIAKQKEWATRRYANTKKLQENEFKIWQKQVQKKAVERFADLRRALQIFPNNAANVYQRILENLGLNN